MSAHPQDDLLAAALDGTLSERDRDAVDAHLEVCAQCRGELELARGARRALRALPAELQPPIDLAVAVAMETSDERGAGGAPATGSGVPRWYRAAGLAAAAAAIALAVMVLPDLGGRDAEQRATTPLDAAAETSPNAAGSEAIATQDGTRGGPDVESLPAHLDLSAVQRLADETDETSVTAPAFASGDAEALTVASKALDCVRSAAGSALPSDAAVVRMISATYLGTPAYLGVAALPDGRTGVWVAARADCRLLASIRTSA